MWLAKNSLGTFRAVKIVFRHPGDQAIHFDRELKGLTSAEPISRSHDGLVDILQVGNDPSGRHFFYVMELADPICLSSEVEDPPSEKPYVPRTLYSDLKTRGALPLSECLSISARLASALDYLHTHGLVHRDIKPSNIIFVEGQPKLADIGLVAPFDDAHSLVGTAGYVAPEGPGTPQADVFSLGKVIYEMAFGKHRQEFPQLPADLHTRPDHAALLALNSIVCNACANDPKKRYRSATVMLEDLNRLQQGRRIPIRRRSPTSLALVGTFCLLLGVLSGVMWMFRHPTKHGHANSAPLSLSTNAEATDLYNMGLHFYKKFTDESKSEARDYFLKAVEKDPQFASALSMLAHCYSYGGPQFNSDLQTARGYAEKALALNPSLSDAHCVSAWIRFKLDWDWSGAELEFQRAIELAPDYAEVRQWYGVFLSQIGKFEMGISQLKEALEIDPLSLSIRARLGASLCQSGQIDVGIRELEKVVALETNSPMIAYANLAKFYAIRGDYPQAIRVGRRVALLKGVPPVEVEHRYEQLESAYRQRGPKGYWEARLDWEKAHGSTYSIACIHAQLGNEDAALTSLEAAYKEHSYELGSYVMMEYMLNGLRSNPRFQALLHRMQLR